MRTEHVTTAGLGLIALGGMLFLPFPRADDPTAVATTATRLLPVEELGRVLRSDVRQIQIEVPNETDATWTLGAREADCDCTTLVACTPTVAPGQSAKIELRFDARERSAGDVYSQFAVEYLRGPLLYGAVSALVIEPPYFERADATLVLPPDENEFVREVRVRHPFEIEAAVLVEEATGASIDVGVPFHDGPGVVVPLLVHGRLTDDRSESAFATRLRILSSTAPDGELLYVHGTIRRDRALDASPALVFVERGAPTPVRVHDGAGRPATGLFWEPSSEDALVVEPGREDGELLVSLGAHPQEEVELEIQDGEGHAKTIVVRATAEALR